MTKMTKMIIIMMTVSQRKMLVQKRSTFPHFLSISNLRIVCTELRLKMTMTTTKSLLMISLLVTDLRVPCIDLSGVPLNPLSLSSSSSEIKP